jgi:hypothetical protein
VVIKPVKFPNIIEAEGFITVFTEGSTAPFEFSPHPIIMQLCGNICFAGIKI